MWLEDVEKQKVAMEKSVETLRKNLVSEASDSNQDHTVKAASFSKTLVEKESTMKDLNMALRNWKRNLNFWNDSLY